MARLDIVLVHGTWARGFFRQRPVADWCRQDSSFVKSLLGRLKIKMPGASPSISIFNWSGKNSIFERATASTDLKAYLETRDNLDTPVLIIAHSHGGNVAMQAVKKLQDASQVYVCTLATPFFKLFATRRQFQASRGVLQSFCAFTMMVVGALVLLKLGVDKSVLVVPLAYAMAFIGWLLGGRLHILLINPEQPHSGDRSTWQLKPHLLAEATAWDARLLADRLLVLRGIDDEAALSLASGAVANRLLRFLYGLATGRAVVVIAILYSFVSQLEKNLGGTPHFDNLFFVLFFVAPFVTAVACLVLPSIFRTVFGRELMFGATRCDAFYDSAPDADLAKVITVRDPRDTERMNHSIHRNPEVPVVVADWISGRIRGRWQTEEGRHTETIESATTTLRP
jgi:Alpha/beta hydrolase family